MTTHLETLSQNSNPTILGYIGAAIFGFIMQFAFHNIMMGNILLAISIILLYSLFIAICEFYCREKNCKFLCELNEFWFTVELIIRKKLKIL